MKHASLLIALCVLFSLSAVAQSTATVEKNTKRITITTTKVNDNGQPVTETWIAEGAEPEQILKDMAINPEVIQQVKIEGDLNATDEERLFLYRSAGDNVIVEGTLNENANQDGHQEYIIINKSDDPNANMECKKISTWHTCGEKPGAYAYVNTGGGQKSNCAALGVYAEAQSDNYGAQIQRLIDKGAAQEAGLLEGDIIKNIDEFDVSDFSTLFFALSHYRPGDQVTIRYERDGKYLSAKASLKDWAEIPGYEYKARTDCGQPEKPVDVVKDQVNTVTITDANGKVVYRDLNDNASGAYNNHIDLKGLPQGNYIISVNQNDQVFTQQISKQ
jgi:PDZ domain/Secretion system C-terminal sorting domain